MVERRCNQCSGPIKRSRRDNRYCSAICKRVAVQGGDREAHSVLSSVCDGTEVTPQDVRGESRLYKIAEMRARAMRAVRNQLGWSLPRIGRFFRRDHSTVAHACRKVDRPLDSFPALPPRHKRLGGAAAPAPVEPRAVMVVPKLSDLPPLIEADDRPIADRTLRMLRGNCEKATSDLRELFGDERYASLRIKPGQIRRPAWY